MSATKPKQIELFVAQQLEAPSLRDDIDIMSLPFFSIEKTPRHDPIEFERNVGDRRQYYSKFAEQIGVDPSIIVGEHSGAAFLPAFKAYDQRMNGQRAPGELEKSAAIPGETEPDLSSPPGLPAANDPGGQDLTPPGGDIYTVAGPNGKKIEFTVPPGASDEQIRQLGIAATKNPRLIGSQVNRPPEGSYQDSYVGQGMSGVNEGIASTLGAPVDLLTAGLNLIPQGINAAANTDLPTIQSGEPVV